jgi:hypothetical protein
MESHPEWEETSRDGNLTGSTVGRNIGVRRGVSKRVGHGRRPLALQGLGMLGPSDTLRSLLPPLAIRLCAEIC